MTQIELRGVQKFFGAVQVIKDLNLKIEDNEFIVLLGQSGCGKTTTLRAIAGLETIDEGDILIDGKPVQHLKASDRDIAFVFQSFSLYPHMTVYENIAFPLRATRMSKARGRQGGARDRQGAAHHRPARQEAVGAVGRRHAARRHRPGAGAAAEGDADGRADRRARRQAARGDARRDQAPAHQAGLDHDLRHARPGRGDEPRRPHRHHA